MLPKVEESITSRVHGQKKWSALDYFLTASSQTQHISLQVPCHLSSISRCGLAGSDEYVYFSVGESIQLMQSWEGISAIAGEDKKVQFLIFSYVLILLKGLSTWIHGRMHFISWKCCLPLCRTLHFYYACSIYMCGK